MPSIAEPVAILRDLVAFNTISRTPNLAIIEYLEKIFQPLGFATQRIFHPDDHSRANLLCSIGPQVAGGLMLSGHTDVVPVEGQDWRHDPFQMYEENGLLIGRGTADMKGFIAATCCALSKISLNKLSKPLSLLWTYDEEIGGFGSATASPLLKKYLPVLPQCALIGEPTSFNIMRMHKGHTVMRIMAKGKGAHSSNPDLGLSAIKAINQAMTGLFELESELEREVNLAEYFHKPFVTLNVGQISGGTAVNIIPDEAMARIGIRPLPGSSVSDLCNRVEMAARKYLKPDSASIRVELEYSAPPLLTKNGTKLEHVLSELAQSPGTAAVNFCTDAGNIANSGIECLIFGPGSIDVAHSANEYLAKYELIAAVDKIRILVERYLF